MKKRPAPFSGLLLVNKPKGPTSHDLVGKLRWCLNTRSVGHGGTLDPMAEGLMVLLIGEATKLSQWVTSATKSYEGVITLGSETDTQDAEGETTKKFDKKTCTRDEAEEVFDSLMGVHELFVPKYSAIKQEGKKLYDLARSGVEVSCPKREMIFYESELLGVEGSEISFSMSCSKGTYVRSWSTEVGKRLGTGAHLSALKRTRINQFYLEDAEDIPFFESLKDLEKEDVIGRVLNSKCFVPLSQALPHAEIVRMNPKEDRLFSNGQIPNGVRVRMSPLLREAFRKEKEYLVRMLRPDGDLAGLMGINHKGQLKIQRVFNGV
jgi:tRNA pseudouridine55 synthase